MSSVDYRPPATIREFIKHHLPGKLFYSWIIGPVGSGKTTGLFMKLAYMAKLQKPGPDGIRRTRCVIVRNTMPQLKDTTMVSWGYWFKDGQAGKWQLTDKIFTLRFGDVECEVLFRPLDTEDDVARVLSLEVTFAVIDEFVEIPRKIIEALAARCGRYPSKKDGGATNWGMWGSSNPSTEDNWWYQYLHKLCDDPNQNLPANAKYFRQPSGMSADAENLENLPGGREYYTSLEVGKSEAWIKQFIESEWGFSISGQPVVRTLEPKRHFVSDLKINMGLDLVVGFDPGIAGSALIFGQLDFDGHLNVLGELVQSGYGAERIIHERLKPYLKARWPGFSPDRVIIAPDPAAANRSQSDEKSVVDRVKMHFPVVCETNNRFPLRLDAIEYYTTRSVLGGPALRIDEKMCPVLSRALRGGWRFEIDKKRDVAKPQVDSNGYDHPGDAFGYLCRYFHKNTEREQRYGVTSARVAPRFRPPRSSGNAYHFK